MRACRRRSRWQSLQAPGMMPGRLLLLVALTGLLGVACGGSSADGGDLGITENRSFGLQPLQSGAAQVIVYASPDAVNEGLPTGESEVEDANADVRSDAGVIGPLPPGLEITGASLVGDGTQLMATWFVPESAPRSLPNGNSLTWLMHLWQEDALIYQLVVQLNGADWTIYTRDMATGVETHFRLASFYADRVEAPFSAASLPNLGDRFRWLAEVTWRAPDGNVWFDRSGDSPHQFP